MNEPEREAIGLCIAIEAVNDIVNRALLEIRPVSSMPGQVEVYFHDRVHEELFLARLLDFSSESQRESITGIRGSCLDVIGHVSETRCLGEAESVRALAEAVGALRRWLDHRTTVKMWIGTLEIEAEVALPRSELLYIMGNHVKHNLARLSGVSSRIGRLMRDHGYSVTDDQVPLALDDFREHLLGNYFIYYGSWLAELVNNVRWGMQDYLAPLYSQCHRRVPGDQGRYEYTYPNEIRDELARAWFWRLLNHVRARPYIERFSCAHYLKRGASIEKP